MRRLAFLLAVLALAGCSATSVATAVNGRVPRDGYVLRDGVSYGSSARQRLDVYVPERPGEARPVVIFFYGGSWQSGRREDYRFVGQALAEKGMVAVLPDYRVHPEVGFPDFVRDGAKVVRWVEENAGAHGGDPGKIFVMGHSAGAHIAALLAYDERYLREAGADRVRGFVGLAGPYDFLPLRDPVLQTLFGPQEGWPESQPVGFVDGTEPPALLLTGCLDWTVSPRNSRRLAARIRKAGGRVELRRYAWLGHRTVIGALASPFRWLAPVLRDTASFVGRESAAGPAKDQP